VAEVANNIADKNIVFIGQFLTALSESKILEKLATAEGQFGTHTHRCPRNLRGGIGRSRPSDFGPPGAPSATLWHERASAASAAELGECAEGDQQQQRGAERTNNNMLVRGPGNSAAPALSVRTDRGDVINSAHN